MEATGWERMPGASTADEDVRSPRIVRFDGVPVVAAL